MHRNVRLVLAYDGTDFHGWQKQPGLRTVQDVVEQAVRRVVRHQAGVTGSGRTDSGVHALGQVANFITTHDMPCDSLRKAIGSRLPKDVSIVHADEVPLGFRATSDAVSKLYRYRIHNATHRPVEEHLQRVSYHFWQPLDVHKMQKAARYLVGEHDFVSFASAGHGRESTIRTVLRFEVYRNHHAILFDVEGTGFLYNQVRNMVGTLIEVGRGHWSPETIPQILEGRSRSLAGPTAPARALCLQWVRYDLTRPYQMPEFLRDPIPLESEPEEPQPETPDEVE